MKRQTGAAQGLIYLAIIIVMVFSAFNLPGQVGMAAGQEQPTASQTALVPGVSTPTPTPVPFPPQAKKNPARRRGSRRWVGGSTSEEPT